MIEKNRETQYPQYEKKIIAYLDGSMNADDKAEFEAFVRTHPEFESQIKVKENELSLLKTLIPATTLSKYSLESIEGEMKQSIFNLLKEEPRNLMDRVKNSWEEWLTR